MRSEQWGRRRPHIDERERMQSSDRKNKTKDMAGRNVWLQKLNPRRIGQGQKGPENPMRFRFTTEGYYF
jgi:hypothetical protein